MCLLHTAVVGEVDAVAAHHYDTITDIPLETPHHYHTIAGIYSKGEPVDLVKYNWYHGSISEDQANAALSTGSYNRFLVRTSACKLVLSKAINGWKSHDIIQRSPKGYRLGGQGKLFKSIPEMVSYYQQLPISGTQLLGTGIDKQFSGILNSY